MQEMYNGVASKVYDVLSSYAQQQGFTLVLDVSQQQNPVLYANESTNITKPVLDAYNVKSGVPAPPPRRRSSAPRPPKPASAPAPAATNRGIAQQKAPQAGPFAVSKQIVKPKHLWSAWPKQ